MQLQCITIQLAPRVQCDNIRISLTLEVISCTLELVIMQLELVMKNVLHY